MVAPVLAVLPCLMGATLCGKKPNERAAHFISWNPATGISQHIMVSSIIPCSFDKLKTTEGPIQSCSTSGNPFCAFLCSAETCFLHIFSSGHAVPHRHCPWLTVPSFVAAAIKAPSNAGGKDWLQLFLQLSILTNPNKVQDSQVTLCLRPTVGTFSKLFDLELTSLKEAICVGKLIYTGNCFKQLCKQRVNV